MKVNSLENRDISFNGFYNSKALKRTLAFAENNGALFMSATSLAFSTLFRPISILSAPNTDKENKRIACSKAITSTLLDFIITFAISAPIVASMGAITKNPSKYLKSETIKNLKGDAKSLSESNAFNFANQLFKLGIGLAIAAPKALLNLAGMPYIMKHVFKERENEENIYTENLSFKGKGDNKLTRLMGKLIDKKSLQEFSKKHENSNYPMHITAIKDTITTGTFMLGAYKSKKIKDERKGPLIYNSFISTALCIAAGYGIDSLTKPLGKNFLKNLERASIADPNLAKYKRGFKIAKPTIIMAIIYYVLIPLFSTYIAERIDKKCPIKK